MLNLQIHHTQGRFVLDVAFEAPGTGVTALYGPSGAGKTSVVNMVAGLLRPDTGRICVNGLCLFDSEQGIDLPPEKRRVGYVFQEGRLFPHLSVRSNLTYGMRRTPADLRFVDFDEVVSLLGIDHLLARRPAGLSGGEKQRVAIGRALLTSPAMLLMDEPLASLDAARKAEVIPFIKKLAGHVSIPVLYVSHEPAEIRALATHMVALQDGRVTAAGTPETLLTKDALTSPWDAAEAAFPLAVP
ncbi:molybdenum ABC transporter ATP-binding protein [Desulfoluna spongiiphila]|uniref:molybdenum ABC transporter ATP-binding protein n=1 Tax=Desulfoluna spongiiphila TaxID=419481 RepID=UPI00125875CE|nr:molybdenum ABC transporter ATP-binding protein [Desulfoluna spongiiphila]VVS92767.1 abc transporter-like [Desulfoluna spongiiphila]